MSNAIVIFERDEVEGKSVGIFQDKAGFLAMTYTASKTFKTLNAAYRWMAKRGFEKGA